MANTTLRAALVELHPTANSAANAQIADVVGNKTDTLAGTSVMAYLKLIESQLMGVQNSLEKISGEAGCSLVTGVVEYVLPVGYAAYAAVVRTDDTQILTLDHIVDDEAVALADATWEGVALTRNDLITFEFPVVAITLNAAGDSILLYLQPTEWVAP